MWSTLHMWILLVPDKIERQLRADISAHVINALTLFSFISG